MTYPLLYCSLSPIYLSLSIISFYLLPFCRSIHPCNNLNRIDESHMAVRIPLSDLVIGWCWVPFPELDQSHQYLQSLFLSSLSTSEICPICPVLVALAIVSVGSSFSDSSKSHCLAGVRIQQDQIAISALRDITETL